MTTSVYTIYDRKTRKFRSDSVMFCFNEDEAKRYVIAAAKAPGSLLSLFPDDYELVYLCDFDDEAGFALSQPEKLCTLRDLIGGE